MLDRDIGQAAFWADRTQDYSWARRGGPVKLGWFYTMSDFWCEDADNIIATIPSLLLTFTLTQISKGIWRKCFEENFSFHFLRSSSSATGFNSRHHTSIILWKKTPRIESWYSNRLNCQKHPVSCLNSTAAAAVINVCRCWVITSSSSRPESVCSTAGRYCWTRTREVMNWLSVSWRNQADWEEGGKKKNSSV